jgi:thioredoxin 1
MEVVMEFVNKLMANPLQIVMVLFIAYRMWQQFQPFPELEGGPKPVLTMQDWAALLADKKNKVIVVDFYATWCGPCKTAAPIYHRMSQEPEFQNVTFRKVDVDKAADVAKACAITAMPTFQVFVDGKVVKTIQGWNEGGLKAAIHECIKKN